MAQTAVMTLGGSLLRAEEGPAHAWLEGLSGLCQALAAAGMRLGIVVGGGAPARDGIELLRPLVPDERRLDQVGIAATRVNATVLQQLLLDAGLSVAQRIPEDVEEAMEVWDGVDIVVMGGTVPGQTTDTVAVELALAARARRCVIATNVAHVHDADPRHDPTARAFDEMDHQELLTIVQATSERGAGARGVVDRVAAGLAADEGLELAVVHGRYLERMEHALLGQAFVGTRVHQD